MNSSTLEAQKSSVLILTGMHRSGTSLATALLQSSGLHIGRRQIKGNQYNVKGYYENVDFLEFHKTVLQSQEIVSEGWTLQENIEVEEQYIEQAQQIIAQNAISSMWGWKDPRTTLFLNFWAKLFPEAKFLLVYRSPWEVIDSLYRRGDEAFDQQPELAVKVWLHYNQKIINFYNQYPSRCILANISQVIKNPKLYIETINQKFGTRLGTPGEEIYESSLFQSYSQDSHRPTVIDYYFPDAIEMYQELEARSWQPDENLDLSWRDRIKSSPYRAWVFQDWMELRRVESLYKSLQADHQLLTAESEQLKSQLSQTQKELEESQSKLQETERDLEKSQSQLSETEKVLNQSQSQLSQTQIELEKSQSQLGQTQEELEQSQSELAETQRVSAQFQTQFSQTQSELTQAQSQLHQTQEELEQSQSQLYETTTILEQSHSQLHQTEEVLEQLLENYKRTEARADKVQEKLEHSESKLYETTTVLEQSQSQLHQTEKVLEQSLDNYKQTQEELEQSQLLLNETQMVLDQSQSQLHQTEQVLEQYYSRYKKSQGELQRNLSQLYRTQKELEQTQVQLKQARNELDRLLFLEAIAGQPDESYQRLVWEAWYAYRNNDLAAMAKNLRKSMKQKPFSKTETVLNWLESFAKFSSERGETLNTQALTNSPEWKQLIRQAISKKSVLARKQSVQQAVSF
ncbi:sulfotransferase family protein [Lyngbya aestuarii BL J]|uniref:Sulfotransferase family protein n=1 Tax=Lyngbya aestuarii BL J TaxID=1348334 RepID=U7QAH0_9CYAN|nr:sulfotransferase [Lyngbya aestuarii]ERT04015.1 sulfotransferase family protein [Lyngbya aestuarii BL J]